MQHRWTHVAALTACCTVLLAQAPALEGEDAPGDGLRLVRHLPRDPVLVWVATFEEPARSFDEMLEWIGRFAEGEASSEIAKTLAEVDAKLGFSLKDDLLANLGPELAVAVDFPPIDQVAAAFASPARGLELLLGRLGVVVNVRDAETIDRCLKRVVELAEGQVRPADDLMRIELGPEPEPGATPQLPMPPLFYGFRGNVLGLGASDVWLRGVLDVGSEPGLAAGEDFKRVFAHLDAAPRTLTYLNLPKLAAMVESSGMLQAMLESDEEAGQAAKLFLSPEFIGMGLGVTSVEVDGGVRSTTFGPSALAGGTLAPGMIAAIAIPNFLNAVDQGKQKRTMADLRSIGTACEAYAIDNERYPGPTQGWVDLSSVASALEPVYIRSLPVTDAWGNPFLYWSDGASYRIASRGKDGEQDPVETEGFDRDIVFADGDFTVRPEED